MSYHNPREVKSLVKTGRYLSEYGWGSYSRITKKDKSKRMVTNIIAAIIFAITAALIIQVYFFSWLSNNQKATQTFTLWLIFTVFLALTPIIFNALIIILQDTSLKMATVLAKGELLIVSVAIGSEASGRLIGSGPSQKTLKIASAGGSIMLVLISSLLYSAISRPSGVPFNSDSVSLTSILIFFITLVSSGSSVLLSEG